MPEVIAEQSYDIVAGLIFLAGESAADGWLQADEAEELGSNLGDGNFTRAAAVPQDPGALRSKQCWRLRHSTYWDSIGLNGLASDSAKTVMTRSDSGN